MSKFIIGDTHGCYKTLLALIAQLPPDAEIVFCGDLIDRGPGSKQIIDLIIQKGYKAIKGNHEDMFLQGLAADDLNAWLRNGGTQTLESYRESPNSIDMSEEHVAFLDNLPLFLEFPDVVREDGRHLLVTHTGLTKAWHNAKAILDKRDNELYRQEFLWNRRPPMKTINQDIYSVFGHTPVREPLIEEHYANIDTGCCFGNKLTALEFPSMKVYSQQMID